MKNFISRGIYWSIVFIVFGFFTKNKGIDGESVLVGILLFLFLILYDVVKVAKEDGKFQKELYEMCIHGLTREVILASIKTIIENDEENEEKIKKIREIVKKITIKIENEEEN